MTLGISYAQEYLSPCILKCKHVTLAIRMLHNIFPLHSKHKIIISSIPICYAKCRNGIKISLKEVTFLDE